MQVYTNSPRGSIKTFVFLALTVVIAYLPVSTFLFFLKNDAFNGYFPPKFFMSESLHSGFIPLWNPYINFGLPQYGDMSSGFWSPVTWLIAATVGYNAYTFTIELLMYILIAGTGMFRLCRYYGLFRHVSLISGLSYMCCGYMVGHLQHFNWISGSAFLPWAIYGYTRLQSHLSAKNLIVASLLFYMLVASAHPGITIGCIYFFLFYAIFVFFKRRSSSSSLNLVEFSKSHLALIAGIGILSAGMILGYADILPHITRGEKVSEIAAMANPVHIQCFVSTILPFPITRNDGFFATDLSMRNLYMSLTMLVFFLLALFSKKNSRQFFFLFTGAFFLLLSLQGLFKSVAYDTLPLIGFVRLNGEFAIFALLSFILVAAFRLNRYIDRSEPFSGRLMVIYYTLELFLAISIIYGLYHSINKHHSFLFGLRSLSSSPGLPGKLKMLIDQVTFYDTLWIQGLIQMVILWGIKFCLVRKNFSGLVKVVAIDVIFATLLNVPSTGVGKASVGEVQHVLNKSPKGIIIPAQEPINIYDTISVYETGLVGNWSFYNKKIGVKAFAFYPIELKTTALVFDPSNELFKKPYIFCTRDGINPSAISVTGFSGNKLSLSINLKNDDTLVYQQNYYDHWFVVNDNNMIAPLTYEYKFLSTPVSFGEHKIDFEFNPTRIKNAMTLSAIAFVLSVIILIILLIRRPSLSSRRK